MKFGAPAAYDAGDFGEINVYAIPALMWDMLRQRVGTARFDTLIRGVACHAPARQLLTRRADPLVEPAHGSGPDPLLPPLAAGEEGAALARRLRQPFDQIQQGARGVLEDAGDVGQEARALLTVDVPVVEAQGQRGHLAHDDLVAFTPTAAS